MKTIIVLLFTTSIFAQTLPLDLKPLTHTNCSPVTITLPTVRSGFISSSDCHLGGSDYGDLYFFSATGDKLISVLASSASSGVFAALLDPSVQYHALGASFITRTSLSGVWSVFVTGPLGASYTLDIRCAETSGVCFTDPASLYMHSDRFRVQLVARDQRTGNTGAGYALPENDIFGYFSIPGLTGVANNPEVFVKILDGRTANGRFWVFYGGLTDLEYVIGIQDTFTGITRTYQKAAGSACGGFDTSAF
jgi:hypothetical protein